MKKMLVSLFVVVLCIMTIIGFNFIIDLLPLAWQGVLIFLLFIYLLHLVHKNLWDE